jgi:hypothetical protein
MGFSLSRCALSVAIVAFAVANAGCVGDVGDVENDVDDESEPEEVGTDQSALIKHWDGHESRHASHIYYAQGRGYQYWKFVSSYFLRDGAHIHRWSIYRCTSSSCATKTFERTANYEVGYRY